jgi:hypothetical protein
MSELLETPAAWFFVLVCAVLCYVVAIVVYFHAVTGFSTGVYVLCGAGTIFFANCLFGSDSTCGPRSRECDNSIPRSFTCR